ncbi:MAG: DUF4118 domain-containing protein [Clostridia bacterium]|nr:DUF4118 domain-containing protein [Clostridia bacterium]MBQ9212157.1 DUF4118 domain-containing protein [Clostridia bacterium]
MEKRPIKKQISSFLLFLLIICFALGVSFLLARVDNDNNPFAMAIFMLAVALIARVTEGYLWGIAASVMGTLCVNYFFSYPFYSFDITYPGYPLTVSVMLIVSILISALTTQIKKQEQLRFEIEREKMHANLLRAIAHDIRTPLASILGASSALQEQKLSSEDQESLIESIHRDAQWLVRVTENLLSVTRFSGSDVAIKKEDEVLEEIIGSAILKYHQMPLSLPVKVESPEEIILVPADGVLLEQVLINLFDNVSAHAEGATQIWLSAMSAENRVMISVEDDGPGIPDAMLPHILDETIQHTNRLRSDDRRSMGIGLSVCRSIIRAHGGELNAGESPHGGAAFRFYLPRKEENNAT